MLGADVRGANIRSRGMAAAVAAAAAKTDEAGAV